jgi:Predicted nucleotidyltransferases
MKTTEEIKKQLSALREIIHTDYGVSRIELFGSYVRGEQRPDSDVDVLVEVDREVSLLDVVGLELFLSDSLGVKVDVVLRRSVRKELKEIIFAEAVPI